MQTYKGLKDYLMAEITLEKTHALLEKLAEYVMNEVPRKDDVPTKKELNDKIWQIQQALDQKADKKDVEMLRNDLRKLLDGQDAMVNQLDIIRTEQYAFNAAFTRLEERVESLESGM